MNLSRRTPFGRSKPKNACNFLSCYSLYLRQTPCQRPVLNARTVADAITNMSLNAQDDMPVRKLASAKESQSSSQTARATLALREMLVQGELRPGEKIREVPLSAQLNVSRIPLHLALERLANEGFLEVLPKRGFRVHRFSVEDIYDSIDLRGLLEGAAARLAAERLQDVRSLAPMAALSQKILALVRKSKMTIDGFTQYIDLNAQFHAALLDLADSRMLRRAIERACCLPFASPSAFLKRQYISIDLRELFLISADQHCVLVDAIADREGLRAESIAREHARVARRNFEDALRHREHIDDLSGAKLVNL
jgi:GntR family transcriptional regulator of vanillate catabolism